MKALRCLRLCGSTTETLRRAQDDSAEGSGRLGDPPLPTTESAYIGVYPWLKPRALVSWW